MNPKLRPQVERAMSFTGLQKYGCSLEHIFWEPAERQKEDDDFLDFFFFSHVAELWNHQSSNNLWEMKCQRHVFGSSSLVACVVSVLSADCSGDSDLTMSPEHRAPIRRSSTRDQDRRSGGTCFLLAASDYTCPADGGLRKTGTTPCTPALAEIKGLNMLNVGNTYFSASSCSVFTKRNHLVTTILNKQDSPSSTNVKAKTKQTKALTADPYP